MSRNLIKIGDLVHVPHLKIIGKVFEKTLIHNEYFIVLVIDHCKTRTTYGSEHTHNNLERIPVDKAFYNSYGRIYVEHTYVKPLNVQSLYNFKGNKGIIFKNLISPKDIKKGNYVKFVDNFYLERIIEQKITIYDERNLEISKLLSEQFILDGRNDTIMNYYLICRTKTKRNRSKLIYLPLDCLELVHRNNLWFRIKKLLRLI